MNHMYRPLRNSGCRIVDDVVYKGCRSLLLENEKLLIHILLDRGGEPIRWLHKPSDTDLIWHSHRGFFPSHPLYKDYEMSYFGGWQEMFPEVSYTSTYRGTTVFRGESAITPWDYEIVKDEPGEIQVLLTNRIRSLPFLTSKRITLTSGSETVHIDETITNLSPSATLEANWGHHLAYGAPFLDRNCFITLDSGTMICNPKSGETWSWPLMKQGGDAIDLARMPDPGTERELLFLLARDNKYRITNPARSVALEVRWDGRIWPYLWYWQNFMADTVAPFFGCDYNIGLEMFNVPPKLTLGEAVQKGLALVVPPLGSISSWLEFTVCTPEI